MNVYKCGTNVLTKLGKVEGIITEVCIRFDSVQYGVSYFKDSEYKTVWLNENEFETDSKQKNKVGFK